MFRIHARGVLAPAFAALLFALAPAAAAQDLAPVRGAPIAYGVELPALPWRTFSDDPEMLTARAPGATIVVVATDVVAKPGPPLPVPVADFRRIFTQKVMGSDSLLMGVLNASLASVRSVNPNEMVREFRTLGGQRAAYGRGRDVRDGKSEWIQVYATVKDGVLYMLMFGAEGNDPDAHQELFGRVHQSFVLAEAPPS